MDHPVYPCLWFDGKAREAAELYCSVFENSRITSESSLVVTFELNGRKFMGLNGGPIFTINPSISLYVNCGTEADTDRAWNILIEGGKPLMPLGSYPWSKRYGWLQDKFGLSWQLTANESTDRSVIPSLLFTGARFGRAEEAIDFYCSVFEPSSSEMLTHYPAESEFAGKVLFSQFRLDTARFIAMDGPGTHEFSFNEAVSLVVDCDTQEEIDYYWEKLTAGGEESMCGWLADKFGVSWQIVPAVIAELMSDPEKAARVTKAFMNMRKLDISTLLKA